MTINELIAGKEYLIRLSNGHWNVGIFNRERTSSGGSWGLRGNFRHFMFNHKRTGRSIEIKSRIHIKPMLEPIGCAVEARCVRALRGALRAGIL